MSREKFKIPTDWLKPVVIDQYKLPPLMVITECHIYWTLAQATTRKHRKYLAASIVLGQPFNLSFKGDL